MDWVGAAGTAEYSHQLGRKLIACLLFRFPIVYRKGASKRLGEAVSSVRFPLVDSYLEMTVEIAISLSPGLSRTWGGRKRRNTNLIITYDGKLTSIVADICTHFYYFSTLLRCTGVDYQLALYRFSSLLRRLMPFHHLPLASRPQTGHHRRLCLASSG